MDRPGSFSLQGIDGLDEGRHGELIPHGPQSSQIGTSCRHPVDRLAGADDVTKVEVVAVQHLYRGSSFPW